MPELMKRVLIDRAGTVLSVDIDRSIGDVGVHASSQDGFYTITATMSAGEARHLAKVLNTYADVLTLDEP